MNGSLAALLTAAGQAPSGDNTQPWRFVIDRERRVISLEENAARDPSPMNAGGRMSRIAIGAALENLVRRARAFGWEAKPVRVAPPALAAVRLSPGGSSTSPVDGVEATRCTNRRRFDGRPIPREVLDRLVDATADSGKVTTHWILGSRRLEKLARLIGDADGTMFGEPSMRRAFLSKVRLDAAPRMTVEEGLSSGSLELTAFDRLALRAIQIAPDRSFELARLSRVFAAKARKLVLSSSGLCLIASQGSRDEDDVLVGRAMQRAWLELAAAGLAVQPMMSLLVLENVWERGDERLIEALGRKRLATLRDEFRTLVPEIDEGRPAFLMRVGYAAAPSGRTGRLPLHEVTAFAGGPPASLTRLESTSLSPGLEGAA